MRDMSNRLMDLLGFFAAGDWVNITSEAKPVATLERAGSKVRCHDVGILWRHGMVTPDCVGACNTRYVITEKGRKAWAALNDKEEVRDGSR